MTTLQNIIFFGIPRTEAYSVALKKRVNVERSKIYFSNTVGSLTALLLGLFLAIILLNFFEVPSTSIILWSLTLLALGITVFMYETSILKKEFTTETITSYVFKRLIIGFSIALVWGFFAQLLPSESMIGYTLAYIAMSTFINIGMLSFSVLPLQYLAYFVGALMPLEIKLYVNYCEFNNPFYLILAVIFFICETVLLRKALVNSKTAIQAIILNEQLKDEIEKSTEAQKRIEFLAYHDHLTGAWNRRYIESFLKEQVNNAHSQQHFFGIILLDINYFKPINDTYGHNFGDDLLVLFTQQLQNNLPSDALIGRFGGDEFIIIFENICSYGALEQIGKALKQSLHQSYTINHITIDSSASVGWSLFPQDANNIDTLIDIADERMYADKKLDHKKSENF